MEGIAFGSYQLLDLIGRGGMGEVWRAYDTNTDRIVAIKVLPEHLARDRQYLERFRREAQAAARLNSPHIVPIHTYGDIDGRLFVDMRLIDGRDLEQVLTAGPLPPERAVRVVEQVAKALAAAHRVGLIHRDVKPSNILLDDDDFAYLIDFGIARGLDEARLTTTGAMVGTWHYMAPERLGGGPVDARVDIYALACILHECLTGERPFAGSTLESQVAGHLNSPPPKPSSRQPAVPASLDGVVATGMAKRPDERYAKTTDLARAARDAVTVPNQRPAARALTPPPQPTVPQRIMVPTTPPPPQLLDHRAAPSSPDPGWRTPLIIGAVALVVLLVAGILIARTLIRDNYYVAAHYDTVAIMKGVPSSILGMTLHEPYLVGCLTSSNSVSLIDVGQSGEYCQVFRLDYLKPSERAQVEAGFAAGSYEEAAAQIEQLAGQALPVCAGSPEAPTPTPSTAETTTTAPTTAAPTAAVPGEDCRAGA